MPYLIVVDEPELGLHPYALEVIASLFQEASHHTQVLVSTQSSAFLNTFEPEDIVVVERNDEATEFIRPDAEKLDAWLEDYALGEIWEKKRHRRRAALMARLYIFAEGRTEQTFANTVLKPHLANFGVYMQNSVVIAHASQKGKSASRRGQKLYRNAKRHQPFSSSRSRGMTCFFTTMVDLYALHANFPGTEEAEKLRHDPYQRVEGSRKVVV